MYAGRIIETGKVRDIYRNPQHPYTQALLEAIPHLGQKRQSACGDPRPAAEPDGSAEGLPLCAALPEAHVGVRRLSAAIEVGGGHVVNCWLAAKQ